MIDLECEDEVWVEEYEDIIDIEKVLVSFEE